jgi:hypothetical protein
METAIPFKFTQCWLLAARLGTHDTLAPRMLPIWQALDTKLRQLGKLHRVKFCLATMQTTSTHFTFSTLNAQVI